MTFADLVTGDSVFVDANTLIRLFQPHPHLGPFCLSSFSASTARISWGSPPVSSSARFPTG